MENTSNGLIGWMAHAIRGQDFRLEVTAEDLRHWSFVQNDGGRLAAQTINRDTGVNSKGSSSTPQLR